MVIGGRGGDAPPRQTGIKKQGSRRQPKVPKDPAGYLTSLRDFGFASGEGADAEQSK